MASAHLVHPTLRQFLVDFPIPEMNADRLEKIRAAPAIPYPPAPDVPGVTVEQRHVPGPAGQPDIRILLYRPVGVPASTLMPGILHVHGGGYVVGAPEMMDASNRLLADALKVVIISVAYRLPPENPYPAPLDDVYAGLLWLHVNAAALGVDPARIAIKGESAGGGLAAGLALLARDRGEVPVAFQCLTYPMIDDRLPATAHPYTGDYVWTEKSNRFGWASYLGQSSRKQAGGPDISPYAAPARATDLAGLPPALIVATALDLFLEDNLDYARRLTRAGVPTELIVYSGAYHGFQMAGDTPVSRRYDADIRAALAAALNP